MNRKFLLYSAFFLISSSPVCLIGQQADIQVSVSLTKLEISYISTLAAHETEHQMFKETLDKAFTASLSKNRLCIFFKAALEKLELKKKKTIAIFLRSKVRQIGNHEVQAFLSYFSQKEIKEGLLIKVPELSDFAISLQRDEGSIAQNLAGVGAAMSGGNQQIRDSQEIAREQQERHEKNKADAAAEVNAARAQRSNSTTSSAASSGQSTPPSKSSPGGSHIGGSRQSMQETSNRNLRALASALPNSDTPKAPVAPPPPPPPAPAAASALTTTANKPAAASSGTNAVANTSTPNPPAALASSSGAAQVAPPTLPAAPVITTATNKPMASLPPVPTQPVVASSGTNVVANISTSLPPTPPTVQPPTPAAPAQPSGAPAARASTGELTDSDWNEKNAREISEAETTKLRADLAKLALALQDKTREFETVDSQRREALAQAVAKAEALEREKNDAMRAQQLAEQERNDIVRSKQALEDTVKSLMGVQMPLKQKKALLKMLTKTIAYATLTEQNIDKTKWRNHLREKYKEQHIKRFRILSKDVNNEQAKLNEAAQGLLDEALKAYNKCDLMLAADKIRAVANLYKASGTSAKSQQTQHSLIQITYRISKHDKNPEQKLDGPYLTAIDKLESFLAGLNFAPQIAQAYLTR